jgi:hypothetical protein
MHASGFDQEMIANDQLMIGAAGIGAQGSSVLQLEKVKGMAPISENFKYGLDDNMMVSANILSNGVSDGSFTFDAGGVLHPNLAMSLEQPVDGAREDHILNKKEEDATTGLQSPMGNASSMKTKGKSPISFQSSSNITIPPLSLSLMESSPNVLVQPTMEEIIAFGGIPKASIGVRSSSRLESQT